MENQSLNLHKTIAAYFNMEQGDIEAFAQLFMESAVVQDEGKTYTGLEAIKRWKANASTQYQYTSVPIACEVNGEKNVVTSRLTGNFPGSPVDLRFFFQLRNDKIASLEIII